MAIETLKVLLSRFQLEKLKIRPPYMEAVISFENKDRKAAWELYIELLTRVATQPLPDRDGDEQTALESVYSIFPTTRDILKKYGTGTIRFSRIAIPVLNQIVRPFTAKWHKLSMAGCFSDSELCKEFREELKLLQIDLRNYNQLLANVAGVEDLTALEERGQYLCKTIRRFKMTKKHKVFVSYYHDDDQQYKNKFTNCLRIIMTS